MAKTFFQSLREKSTFAYDKFQKKVEKGEGEPQLKDVLDAWMESTKVSITIFGKSNVDQILLLNAILEETTKKPSDGTITETLWPDIEKQIKTPLLYNDKFPSTINWNKEKESQQTIKNYSLNNNRNLLDLEHGFILPTNMREFSTSPIICYGLIPEIIITFPKETEVRNALWEHYLISTGCKRVDENKRRILMQFHNNIFKNQNSYGFVSNAKQIPIPKNFLNVIGKTFCFKGKGENIAIDRIFIREKLKEIARQYGFLTHNVIVKLPSKMVEGKIEVILADIVDNDESKKWKALNSLKRSNLLVLTVDENGICEETCDMLFKSGFIEKLLEGTEEQRIIVSELSERNQIFPTNFNSSGAILREKFISEILNYMKKHSYNNDFLDSVENNLLSVCTFLPIKPILYSSIIETSKTLNLENGTQQLESLLDAGKTTNIPSLVKHLFCLCSF